MKCAESEVKDAKIDSLTGHIHILLLPECKFSEFWWTAFIILYLQQYISNPDTILSYESYLVRLNLWPR